MTGLLVPVVPNLMVLASGKNGISRTEMVLEWGYHGIQIERTSIREYQSDMNGILVDTFWQSNVAGLVFIIELNGGSSGACPH